MSVQPLARMSQKRAKDDLKIDQRRGDNSQPTQPAAVVDRPRRRTVAPFARSEQYQAHRQSEKGLGQAGMNDRQRLFQQHDAQSAQDPLEDHESESGAAEPAKPAALFLEPERYGQHDGG